MRISTSNETDDNKRRPLASIFWHGRAWLYPTEKPGVRYHALGHAEWCFGRRATSFAWITELGEGDSDRDISFHIAIPFLFSLWLILEDILPRGTRFAGHNKSRRVGLEWNNATLRFHLWSRGSMGDWNSKDPWWVHGIKIDFERLIFGRTKYTEEDVSEWKDTIIPMPEGIYPAQVKIYMGVWRNRFRTRSIRRSEIKVEGGVPFPGKGENSWDCGEDACYSCSTPAATEWDAIGQFVASVMRNRIRYGSGIKWRPKPKVVTGLQNSQ